MLEVKIHYPIGRRIDEPTYDRVRFEFTLPKRPFLFWYDRNIEVGECLQFPKGFGLAYYKTYTDNLQPRCLMAPMPFNILIGFGVWLYFWTRYGVAGWLHGHLPKGERCCH